MIETQPGEWPRRCPRCNIGVIPDSRYASLSRAARDDSDAEVFVCGMCGGDEGSLQLAGIVIDPSEWPIRMVRISSLANASHVPGWREYLAPFGEAAR